MLFGTAGGLMLLGKCAHTNTSREMVERMIESQKRTERYSRLAPAAHVDELEQEERETPANTC